jgi:hypothetical protein
MECFQPHGDFHAIVIADQYHWLAALPLVSCRVGWVIPAGGLPSNPWADCGDLLLDRTSDATMVMDALLSEIAGLPWPLMWLNETAFESPRWQLFLDACQRANVMATHHERYSVGRVLIDDSWDVYQKGLRKNHRQAMQRALRRLSIEGRVQFEMRSRMTVDEVEPWLHDAFELEDRGWKGEAGTSILQTPNMFEFFVGHAKQLAKWGQLEVASLRLDGAMLAFLYGFRAKGVYFSHKISYDPRFAAFSPGQLLFHHVLERLHSEGDVRSLDFMGPINQSLSRWRPKVYSIGRIALAPQRWLGRTTMYAYQHWWRPFRDWEMSVEARFRPNVPATSIEDSAVWVPEKTQG